jgi:hypothetical protein
MQRRRRESPARTSPILARCPSSPERPPVADSAAHVRRVDCGPSGSHRPLIDRYAPPHRITAGAGVSCPLVTSRERPLQRQPSMVRNSTARSHTSPSRACQHLEATRAGLPVDALSGVSGPGELAHLLAAGFSGANARVDARPSMKDEALPRCGSDGERRGRAADAAAGPVRPVRTFSEHACHRGTWSTGRPNG